MGLAVLVNGSHETTDRVDLAIQNRRADMVEAVRQRRERTPAVRRWVIFVVIRPRHTLDAAAEHVDFSTERRERDFVARERNRGPHRPASLGLTANIGSGQAEHQAHPRQGV
jgi:hypothetical protein